VPNVVSPVLVGREQELARLGAAVSRTLAGEPGVVLVGGEAGVGKSRLLEEAFEQRTDVLLLSGGCIELGGESLPFVPLVDALRTLARTTPAGDLDLMLGPARPELARLLPELADRDAPPPPAGGTAQLFELVLGVLGRIGQQRPLVFVIEDLHWADRSTLDLMTFLVRALQGLRVLLVLSYRSDEVDRRSPLRSLLSGWERLRGVERLELARFSRSQVATQIGAILGAAAEPALVDTVFDRSEGNPFFVEELLHSLQEGASEQELPPSLRDLLLARAERLSAPARRLLRTASVAGRWVPERLLAEVASVPAAERYEALREAVDASLLVVDGTGRGYAFRHALTRDAIYQDLLPGERVDLHTAYAEALDRDPGLAGEEASVAATLAIHWYAAHDLPRALAASVRAGQEAIAGYAPAEARRHLERALEVWRGVPDAEVRAGMDEVDVHRLAARAAADSGDPDRALSLLDQAFGGVDPHDDAERAGLIVEQRVSTLRMLGEDGAAVGRLEEALAWLPADPPSAARAGLLASLAQTLLRIGDDRGVDTARTALAAARAVGARAHQASALTSLGCALTYQGDAAEGEASLREGLRLALELPDKTEGLRAYANLSDSLEARGKHREATEAARAGVDLARRVGVYRTFGVFLVGNLIEPLARLGNWQEAEAAARENLATGPTGIFAASLLELCGYLAVCRGELDEAVRLTAEARRFLRASRETQFTHTLAYTEADAARGRGDLAAAAAIVLDGLSEPSVWSNRYAWPLLWLGARVEADAAVLARDRGEQPPPPFMAAAPRPTNSAELSPAVAAYRAMAEAEQLRRDDAPSSDAWRGVVVAWEVAGDVWPLAYARYRLAEALCAEGHRDQAAAPARLAHRDAEALGAVPLRDDVVALARRARVPLEEPSSPQPDKPELPFSLTEREREVLALVAAGHSNGQIAAALFISPKTASVHVSNILAKLGVSGRVAAAGIAHRLGLLQPPVS
jgi:DNA-binding CsgD family transcriptional regulator/tetratricopeptide (TPR) repeat protein